MKELLEDFGELVFNDKAMQKYLSKNVYEQLRQTRDKALPLPHDLADPVAKGMKEWAVSMGATHYTHWFQPMTGVTAEKHDAFLTPAEGGEAILEFSGRELVRGEPDASSFPSGGLRTTFEARGYTAWDPSSFAFIKDRSLCIPTAFCSFGGHAMDKKTPLLRSMQALNRQGLRILRLFGDTESQMVISNAGIEQEYFLLDAKLFHKRPDLVNCSRTLYGARAPKGQELNDHYFGSLKPRVSAFMQDLDRELWSLGVPAKTKHNEVAPSQHELAPVYATVNVACDQNQLMMETMKTVAGRHGLVCLLHEKPYLGLNGSGKHNNWSLGTDKGQNLLDPGETPAENAQFLLFLSAILTAVDRYQGLLRISASGAGNDHRLGAAEAPPAVMSIFLGDELTGILDDLQQGAMTPRHAAVEIEIGVDVLPHFKRDIADRNRTSPFSFTGNRFEFRMVGASASVACPNMIINSIVADTLSIFADRLETASDFHEELNKLILEAITNHKRIIFNGNSYAEAWKVEAKKRGLINWENSVEALSHYTDPEYEVMFNRQCVLTKDELKMRRDVLLENYCTTVQIEAFTMLEMANRGIIPQALKYQKELADTIKLKSTAIPGIDCRTESQILQDVSALTAKLSTAMAELRRKLRQVPVHEDPAVPASYYHDVILQLMHEMREPADQIELIEGQDYLPYPSYQELLYSEY